MSAVGLPDATGAFRYGESGFGLTPPYGTGQYEWADLQSAFGFKLDCLVVDEIGVDLFFGKGLSVRLTESLPGWPTFLQQFRNRFPAVPEQWERDVMFPPFATNLTLLFDRSGRSLPQAESVWYNA
ncbi:hypothetical protein [Hymenobacter sp. CRA2]|uniref:hypothetical protein n=1 Tax=Hymenobacter sp. CRA2 TaxID=1955620 RepID=UPI00098ECE65|nr:hypothetical protein [Hymenobacter sp. CRA2]OON65279.1 hypothetical protein B0919_24450 [Hymenobacter sp. CRA2]